jgi:hypothetical protein
VKGTNVSIVVLRHRPRRDPEYTLARHVAYEVVRLLIVIMREIHRRAWVEENRRLSRGQRE